MSMSPNLRDNDSGFEVVKNHDPLSGALLAGTFVRVRGSCLVMAPDRGRPEAP